MITNVVITNVLVRI